jgi:hypothetical protein
MEHVRDALSVEFTVVYLHSTVQYRFEMTRRDGPEDIQKTRGTRGFALRLP